MVFHKRLFFNVEDAGLAVKQQSNSRIPDWLRRSFPARGAAAIRGGGVTIQIKRSLCDLFFLFPFCSLEQARFANRKQKNPTCVGLDLGWWRIPDSNR